MYARLRGSEMCFHASLYAELYSSSPSQGFAF